MVSVFSRTKESDLFREILIFRLSQVVDTMRIDHVVPENVKMPGSKAAMVETNES